MPRTARLLLPGACYHVIARGNEKRTVFKDEEDYGKYLGIVRRYKGLYRFKIYGYCLMGNHVHLVVESAVLPKVMHGINLSYAKYFRYKYGGAGHFWQDRFRSFAIQKDRYLVNCISYIEYNPLRAQIALRAEDYEWSSYRARILGKEGDLTDQLII